MDSLPDGKRARPVDPPSDSGFETVLSKSQRKRRRRKAAREAAQAEQTRQLPTSDAEPTERVLPTEEPTPRTLPSEDPSEGALPTEASRFIVKTKEPVNFVNALGKDPRLRFQCRPNRYGDFVIYSRCGQTTDILSKVPDLQRMKDRIFKVVLLHYPVHMPLTPVQDLPDVINVYRCNSKTKEPLRKLIVTSRKPVPARVNLGVWGSFPTTTFTPEPLRCFKCQRYGHHQERCTEKMRCGVCSGFHTTELCISALKRNLTPIPKCPNCGKGHHAWSRFCKTRLDAIRQAKSRLPRTEPPAKAAPAPPRLSVKDFPPLQQSVPKQRPTTNPQPQPIEQQSPKSTAEASTCTEEVPPLIRSKATLEELSQEKMKLLMTPPDVRAFYELFLKYIRRTDHDEAYYICKRWINDEFRPSKG